jgi:YafQ family addiction module toxin component
MFEINIEKHLQKKIKILKRKAKPLAESLKRKIEEIKNQDNTGIDTYKNLRNPLQDLKRVHINRPFVLVFKVYKEENFILFIDFDQHDNIYKKNYSKK